MKLSKKIISVVLALTMIMSAVSVCFVSFAHFNDVSDVEWDALYQALQNDYVKNANYNIVTPDTYTPGEPELYGGGTYTMTVEDNLNGDIAKAYAAYLTIFNKALEVLGNQNNSYRCTTQIKNYIYTKLQGFDATVFEDYNMATVLNAFVASCVVKLDNNIGSSKDNYLLDKEIVVKIIPNVNAILTTAATLDEAEGKLAYNIYSVKNERNRYFSGGYKYYAVVKNPMSSTSATAADISTLKALQSVVDEYSAYFSYSLADILAESADERTAAYNALNDAYTAASALFTADIMEHFFKEVPGVIKLIEDANNVAQYKELCDKIMIECETDYTGYDSAALNELYTTITTDYANFNNIVEDVRVFLAENGFIDVAAVDEYIAALKKETQLALIREFKPIVDEAIAKYEGYNEDDVLNGTITDIEAAAGEIKGCLTTLNGYDAENVAEVCGDTYLADLASLSAELDRLVAVADGDAAFAEKYAQYIALAYDKIDLDASTEEMIAKIDEYKEWLIGLEDFCAELEANVGETAANKIYGDLKAEMENQLMNRYNVLGARSAAQVDNAYSIYDVVHNFYGDKATIASIASYKALKSALANLDKELYTYLENASEYDINADTAAKYAELYTVVFDSYDSFVDSNGLDRYEKTEIDDIVRPYDETKDIARDKDYTVTDEKVEGIIELLDKALGSDEVKELLGFDLAELINKLPEKLYSDEMMNTIVGALFPMITDLAIPLLTTMIPIEIDIPSEGGGIPDIVKGKHVVINLPELLKIAQNAGFLLFPVQLADTVKAAGFENAAAALAAAVTAPSFTADKVDGEWVKDENGDYVNAVLNNPWYDAVLHYTYDEEGNPVKDDEGSYVLSDKLTIEWGIEDKDDFVNALAAVIGWLEPALASILGNDYTVIRRNLSTDSKTIVIEKVAKILGVDVDFYINVLHVVLKLGKDGAGSDLYNNVLAPVFEILGVSQDKIADGKTFTVTTDDDDLGISSDNYQTTKDMLYAILNPVEDILNEIAASPVSFVAKVLPNLTYALESGAVTNLLQKLLEITLDVKLGTPADKDGACNAHAVINIGLNSLWSALGVNPKDLYEAFGLDMFIDGFTSPMTLNIYEIAGLDNLVINGTKIDLESLNGLLAAVLKLVGADIELPQIDVATLATLGTLEWNETKRDKKAYNYGDEDKAAYINANKADVLLFVLDYVFTALADPDFLPSVLALINGDTENAAELPAIVKEIIANIVSNPDNSIAAVTELVYPQEYTMPTITWRDPIEAEEGQSLVTYSEYWTQDKALYVAQNLPTFVNNLLMLSGIEMDGTKIETLAQLVDVLVAKLYTAETANKLLDTIKGVVAGLDLDESLMNVLTELILEPNGIDLSAWDSIEAYDFADGDKAAFKAAVVEMLKPLTSILNFILSDKDLLVKLTDSNGEFTLVTANGYDGYSFGLVPLLEALDADVMTTTDFLADSENTAENLVTMLLSAVDKIADDPYDQVFKIIPDVLYFIASDGVTVAVDSLLFAVNVLLDTIRPIYDVNIYSLIDFDIRFAETDPVEFLFSFVAAKLEEATGADFDIDFTADDLCDSLAFGDRTEYESANGYTAYKIETNDMTRADMITVILRYVLRQFVFSENAVTYADLAKDKFNLDDNTYAFLYSVLFTMRYLSDEHPDYALGILFWIFYGADTAADAVADYYRYYDYNWAELIKNLGDKEIPAADKAVYLMTQFYKKTFKDIYDEYLSATAKKVAGRLGAVKDEINNKLATIPGFINGTFDEFFADVNGTLDDVNDKLDDVADKIEDANEEMNGFFARILKMLRELFDKIKQLFSIGK